MENSHFHNASYGTINIKKAINIQKVVFPLLETSCVTMCKAPDGGLESEDSK
jgi:hypothetical protein